LSKKFYLIKEVICYSCLDLAISVQIWLSVRCPRPLYGPDCEKLKSTCDNLGAEYSSYVDGKQLYENIPDCKMLVASRATSNYRVLTFFELLCKKRWRWQYLSQAASDLSTK